MKNGNCGLADLAVELATLTFGLYDLGKKAAE